MTSIASVKPIPTNFLGSRTLAAPVLSYTVASSTRLDFTWTAPTNGAVYLLERADDNLFTVNLTSVYNNTGNAFSDTGRTAGNIYYYRITVSNVGYNNSIYGVKAAMSGTNASAIAVSNNNINGGYAAGSILPFVPGTYQTQVTAQNLSNVTLDFTGVIFDGGTFPYNNGNVLTLQNCTNVIVKNLRTQNCGYHAAYLNNRNVNVSFDGLTFDNCYQAFLVAKNGGDIVWDTTDATVQFLNISFLNCLFNNMSNDPTASDPINAEGRIIYISSDSNNTNVLNLCKNLLVAGCTFTGGNPGNCLASNAIDNYKIYNNTITGVNLNVLNDTRLFSLSGNGDFYNNRADNNRGHIAACFPLSFGTVKKTCNFHHNVATNGLRYSAFEYQEFPARYNSSVLSCDLNVYNNSCGNLNLDNWVPPGNAIFATAFIDNYGSSRSGLISLTNNLGWNWNRKPTGGNFYNTDLATPDTISGNQYVDTQGQAVDPSLNSKFTGVGAY